MLERENSRTATPDPDAVAFNLDQVARKLGGVTRRYVEVLINSGELPSFKLGRRRLVAATDLKHFVDELREQEQTARRNAGAA